MHSYLIMNTKSKLKFINDEMTLEEFDETLNQVALSINNRIDLFDDDNIEVDFENINEIDEAIELKGIDNNGLEIENIIDLSISLLDNKYDRQVEVSIMDYRDLNFDVDDLINSFDNSL
ncbi:hypothetical protein GLOIN_2v1821413 [Rhizophagus clarus]|nr:hypothetical protein GLOIN_2v1821413 [Rhizophagus clarus]